MAAKAFDGAVYDPQHDDARLGSQLGRVTAAVIHGEWMTLQEVEAATGDPQASISAQLRHLRKAKHGGYTVQKRPRGDRSAGLWEYRVLPPAAPLEGMANG